MIIREKDIAFVFVQQWSPGNMLLIVRVMDVSDGWIRRVCMVRQQGPIGQEDGVGVAGVSLDTDRIAQIPVVELAEIGCRPALQIRRTSEDIRCEKLIFSQRAEKLI